MNIPEYVWEKYIYLSLTFPLKSSLIRSKCIEIQSTTWNPLGAIKIWLEALTVLKLKFRRQFMQVKLNSGNKLLLGILGLFVKVVLLTTL